MHWVHIITAVILLISATAAKQDDSNEIDPLRPPINLDANLRRALLKALTELENEDKEKERAKSSESQEKSFERASASAVSFYSHSVSSERPSSTTTSTSTEEPITEQQLVVIQKSSGIQSRPITTYIRDGDGDEIIPSASNSFNSPQNAIFVTPKKNDKISYQHKSTRKGTKRPRPTTTQTTTPTTTTSTEENEAKVEDLQFFSAPLVAAFTVHQDERGIPQSVVPIYKTLEQQKAAKKKPVEQTTAKQQEQFINKQREQQFEQSTFKPQNQFVQQEDFNRNEVPNQKLSESQFRALQEELHEKQKILEEELQKLHQQQKHHDLLLRQQQILQEERLIIEKQKLVNEQIKLNNSQKPFITPTAGTFTTPTFAHSTLTTPSFVQPKFSTPAFIPTRFNSPETTSKRTSVVLQPSVSFNSGLPTNGQILPVKNAGNFRTPFLQSFNLISPQQTFPRQSFNQQSTIQQQQQQQQQQQLQQQQQRQQQAPFPQQQTSFRTQQFSQQSSQPSNNNQQNVNILKSSSAYFTPQHNRVFRQEANVGNFGFNNNNNNNFNNNNRFNNFNSQQQQNRFFRSNSPTTTNNNNNINNNNNSFRAQPPVVNNRLNNLLYNSGFYKGRQQEDINVVSKVLSLNHFGGDLRFESSNLNEQRITRPIVNKV